MHAYRAQMQLFVYAKKSLQPRITNVQQSVENTGFLHVFPNKGGILVTMQVDGTSLAFISCHLSAHEGVKHCEERNASIYEIFGGVRAGDVRFDVAEQSHHLFWMGDMNYRTTYDSEHLPANTKKNIKTMNSTAATPGTSGSASPAPRKHAHEDSEEEEEAEEDGDKAGEKARKKKEWTANRRQTMEMIVQERWGDILALDELNREIKAGRVFDGFTALQPHWPPTFKRTRQNAINHAMAMGALKPNPLLKDKNQRSSSRMWVLGAEDAAAEIAVGRFYDDKRMPSYTDRILSHSMPAFSPPVPLFFDSCERPPSSDHKPVRAGYELNLTKGHAGLLVDKQLLRWKGTVSKKTSGSRSDAHVLRLTLSQLRGENLEEMDAAMFGGGSDPYIVLTADPPGAMLHKGTLSGAYDGITSKVVKHDLNPVWKEDMHCMLSSIDLAGLCRTSSLILSVWDQDTMNADDLIGVCSIPLKDIIHSHTQGNDLFFKKTLHSNTEVMGSLMGKVTIDGDFKDLIIAYNKLESERGNSDTFIPLDEALRMADHTHGCACTLS
ncbi:Endonuclease/exonuclease/phosphatase [Ochromonadaceae sp. CCMP2298]|nr:Endonuclease/exonuclease/phosphatase [Ochromonadaceae sp. CCMP2298]